MKRLLFFAIIVILLPQTLSSYSFVKDGIYYEILSSADLTVAVTCKSKTWGGADIGRYIYTSNYTGNVVIPSTVEYGELEFNVIKIDEGAFSNCKTLLSVAIPSSIKTIGEFAFESCSNLFSISIPSSVTLIKRGAFNHSGIRKLTIEDGNSKITINSYYLSYVYYGPFYYTSLIDVYIGRDLENISVTGGYALQTKCNKVIIGQYVTDLSNVKYVADCSECRELICHALCPPDGTLYNMDERIIVPSSSVEAYKEKWLPQNGQKILPITDVMFFNQTSIIDYQNIMNDIDKSEINSVGFYGQTIDEEFTGEIVQTGINPNCVFLVPSLENKDWKNTINFNNGECNNLELKSLYPFSIPMKCIANKISLEYCPKKWADGTKGWESISLPFECSNVEASDKGAISPVMQGSKGNFWLRQYVGSSDDAVYFASTSDGVMHANTPYLIAFPGNSMGAGSLEGQTITFKAKNVTIPVTTQPSIQKNNFTFVGNYDNTADEGEGWVLNADGSAFVKSSTVGDKPFSGYFKCELPDASSAPSLRMDFGQFDNATGLEMLTTDLVDFQNEDAYTLDGRKIKASNLKAGLYIINNKKVMIR